MFDTIYILHVLHVKLFSFKIATLLLKQIMCHSITKTYYLSSSIISQFQL
jgi:hypothetical protein